MDREGARGDVRATPSEGPADAPRPPLDEATEERLALVRAELLGQQPPQRGAPLALAVALLGVAVAAQIRAWRPVRPG